MAPRETGTGPSNGNPERVNGPWPGGTCRQGLHPKPESGRCRPCRRVNVREAQARYKGTAKGMLTDLRYEARRRGHR